MALLGQLEHVLNTAYKGPLTQIKNAHLLWIIKRFDEHFVVRGVWRPVDQNRVSDLEGVVEYFWDDWTFFLLKAANEAEARPVSIKEGPLHFKVFVKVKAVLEALVAEGEALADISRQGELGLKRLFWIVMNYIEESQLVEVIRVRNLLQLFF